MLGSGFAPTCAKTCEISAPNKTSEFSETNYFSETSEFSEISELSELGEPCGPIKTGEPSEFFLVFRVESCFNFHSMIKTSKDKIRWGLIYSNVDQTFAPLAVRVCLCISSIWRAAPVWDKNQGERGEHIEYTAPYYLHSFPISICHCHGLCQVVWQLHLLVVIATQLVCDIAALVCSISIMGRQGTRWDASLFYHNYFLRHVPTITQESQLLMARYSQYKWDKQCQEKSSSVHISKTQPFFLNLYSAERWSIENTFWIWIIKWTAKRPQLTFKDSPVAVFFIQVSKLETRWPKELCFVMLKLHFLTPGLNLVMG